MAESTIRMDTRPAARRTARRGWWRRVRFRDVLVLTAPLALVFTYIFASAFLDYRNVTRFGDWFARSATLYGALAARIHVAVAYPRVAALADSLGAEHPEAAIIRLRLSGYSWQGLQGDALRNRTEWLDGEVIRGNATHDVRVRRRGDNSIHWTTPKRSFTLRAQRDELFKGFRTLALSGKDVLPQYVASGLAEEFQLLAPSTWLAPVFVNDRFYGIFRAVEIGDDMFLRRHDRLPGNIFRGDAAERDEVFRGVERNLFLNPYIWERESIVDHTPGAGSAALASFLTELNGPSFESYLRAWRRLDRDEVARGLAYMLVVGDPYHVDDLHNQLWYEDPATGRLHNIPWDVRLLELVRTPQWISRYFELVMRDPFVVDGILRTIHARSRDGALLRRAEALSEGAEARFGRYLRYDRLRKGLIPAVGEEGEPVAIVRRNLELLGTWMADSRVAAHAAPSPGGAAVLDLETRGYAGADLLALELRGAGAASARGARLVMDRNRNGALDASDPTVPTVWRPGENGGRLALVKPEALLPGWRVSNLDRGGILPSTVHYRFFLLGAGEQGDVAVEPELRNRVTGAAAEVVAWERGAVVSPSRSWSPWQFPEERGVTRRLAGAVSLRETLRIAASDTLVIEPGTTLRLAPRVSVLVHGRLLARGTASQPITVTALVPDSAWGAIALQGQGASGSALEHVRFERGSAATMDGVAYTAMLNVHAADDVTISRARFARSLRGGDGVRVVSAGARIEDSRFADISGDAIDLELARGIIARNEIERAGSDGIELTLSAPTIVDNRIRHAKGSGVSVGERSAPLIAGNEITESGRGIEVRDRSEPVIVQNLVTRNVVGIRQGLRNWQYGGGGWAKVVGTIVTGNQLDLESDDRSHLTIGGVVQADSAVGAGATLVANGAASAAPTSGSHELVTWLLAERGVKASMSADGVTGAWSLTAPLAPIDAGTFEDDLGETSNGWRSTGGVSRLEKEDGALAMSLRKQRGAIGLPVDWDLRSRADGGADGGILLLEIAGRDILEPTITLISDRGRVTHTLPDAVNLKSFRYVVIPLPAARYTAVEIAATPRPDAVQVEQSSGFLDLKTGRIELRSYRVLAGPVGAESVTTTARR